MNLNIRDAILELLTECYDSMSWMVEDMKHRHNDTGIEGDYSPQLKRAIKTVERLEKLFAGEENEVQSRPD